MSSKEFEYAYKKDENEKGYYVPIIMFLSAFLMYVLAVLPILISRGLPFFYYGDYNVQQIPFYTVAHRAVQNGDLLWNWYTDLGGTIFGSYSFYLFGSPFFWLTTLFHESAIPYLMPFLMALKYATSATCAYLYIRRFVHKYTYAMIGGYLYAFSGFNACNIVFNHFTDAVAFFPLFLLAFDNLMDAPTTDEKGSFKPAGKNFVFFAFMTAVMSIINYYFFFGQVIFLVIYFFIRYGLNSSLKKGFVLFQRALLGGITGVLLAGFFLMQAFAGLKGNTRLDNYINGYDTLVYPSEKLLWDILKSVSMLPDIIGKGTLFYTATVKNASLAAYLPLFGISGVIGYFILKKRRKDWEKTLMIVCGIIAVIPVLNSSFSLFNSNYYARWYYMPILIMCLMTAQLVERGRTSQFRKGAVAAVLLFLFFVLVYLLPSTNDDGNIVFLNMTENNTIFLRDVLGTSIMSFFLLIIAFMFPKKFRIEKLLEAQEKEESEEGEAIVELIEPEKPAKPERKGVRISLRDSLILALVIISCVLSTFIPLKNGSSFISDRGKQKWQEQMLFNKVSVDQTSFCRGEIDSTSTNYDMVWGIPSVSCFLSTVPSEIFDFLKGTGNITRTVSTSLPLDRTGMRAILSVRYYMENADISKNRVFCNGEGTDGYVYSDNQNGFDIFENTNYIPMGFAYDCFISESEWGDLDAAQHDLDLSKVVIIPDEAVIKYSGKLDMTELTAEDLMMDKMDYHDFKEECENRKAAACKIFEPDTKGFSAVTTDLKGDCLVFFSVPNTEGFSCKVDGEDTEIIMADYGMMAIPVKAGEHTIRVTYTPEGFKSGMIMTVTGLAILLVYFFVTLKYIKKND